jgi:hypothetical protein
MGWGARWLAGVAVAAVSAAGVAAQEAAVRAVTLSSAGLVEILRGAPVAAGRAAVAIEVPRGEVSSVLKSLVLAGEGIAAARLRLEGPAPLDEAFARLAIRPDQLASLAGLVEAFVGTEVTLRDPGGAPVTGRLMGFAPAPCAEAGEDCRDTILIRLDAGGVRRVPVADGADIGFPAEAAAVIDRGLDALAGAAGDRMRRIGVEVETAPGAQGEIGVAYLLPAPPWRASYRISVGEGGAVEVQAWAIVENTTGDDWRDVALTLSSGRPQTLAVNLFEREGRPAPQMFRAAEALPQAAMADAAVAMAPVMPAPVGAGAAAQETESDARFTFDAGVSLADGEMLSIPFLAGSVDGRRFAHVDGRQSWLAHPRFVLDLRNSLAVTLPDGVATIFEAGAGYRGDAMLRPLAPGARQVVPYAEDRKTLVSIVREERDEPGSARLARNALGELAVEIGVARLRETTYRLTAPPEEDRLVVVDHPVEEGWTLDPSLAPAPERVTLDDGTRVDRVELPLAAGEARDLVLRERREFAYAEVLGQLSGDRLRGLLQQAMAEEDRALVALLADLRLREIDLGAERGRVAARRDSEVKEQDRLRGLLQSVPSGSEAQRRYLEMVLAQEEAIAAARAEDERLAAELAEVEAEIDGMLRGSDGGR